MPKKLTITQLPLEGKRVLVRVDFNVPFDEKGKISNDARIQASLPTIQYILKQGGSVILMSHLGRPKDSQDPKLSLAPCAIRLSELLGQPVIMAPDCVGTAVEQLAKSLAPRQVILLENLRFHRGEEHPEEDPEFAKKLAALGDIYVDDAFGAAHRAHASIVEVPKFFPGKAAAGFLLEKEIQFLGNTLRDPKRPFYAIIGGAKISSKIGVLKALLKKIDALFIGGGMAYTFFKADGIAIGNSIHEDELLSEAKEIMAEAKKKGIPIYLPSDVIVTDRLAPDAVAKVIEISNGIPDGLMGADIGPKTVSEYVKNLKNASTVFWNGPMGVFELPQFSQGTNAIARALAQTSATTIVGGGESVAAIEAAGVVDRISHISTGGGASLEYIELGTLPGIEALSSCDRKGT